MSYLIEEAPIQQAHNIHIWVEHDQTVAQLLDQLDGLTYILYLTVVEPMKPHHGRFRQAVFVQVPSALYAKTIRGRVMTLLGANREVQH